MTGHPGIWTFLVHVLTYYYTIPLCVLLSFLYHQQEHQMDTEQSDEHTTKRQCIVLFTIGYPGWTIGVSLGVSLEHLLGVLFACEE